MKITSILSLAKIQENENPLFNPPYLLGFQGQKITRVSYMRVHLIGIPSLLDFWKSMLFKRSSQM